MLFIHTDNVNGAWSQALDLIEAHGIAEPSRNGTVRVTPVPVATVYNNPRERVLFDPVRDANPIFHLHEALWMLAGRNDATWLDQFVSDFSARYAEPDGTMHGAYGYRWRNHFLEDQLDTAVGLLVEDPTTRQVVIQMWDSYTDLGAVGVKDRPCNTQIYLRIMGGFEQGQLDMCVMCRSNDIVWGAYGANAVHFSILQEYLAARIDVQIGTLTQFSWNWHMYDSTRKLADARSAGLHAHAPYPGTQSLVASPETFDEEVRAYVDDPLLSEGAHNRFLAETARPMWMANVARKTGKMNEALRHAHAIQAPDWRQATVAWLERRKK